MHVIINMFLYGTLGGILGHLKIHYDSIWFWGISLIVTGAQVNSYFQGRREK